MPERLTPEAREQIRQRAEAATPGPWVQHGRVVDSSAELSATYRGKPVTYQRRVATIQVGDLSPKEQADHDAAYIASVDPTTILSLLAELDALQRYRDCQHEVSVTMDCDPGELQCSKCKIVFPKSVCFAIRRWESEPPIPY